MKKRAILRRLKGCSELSLWLGGFDPAAVTVDGGILGRRLAAAVEVEGRQGSIRGVTPGHERGLGAVGVGEWSRAASKSQKYNNLEQHDFNLAICGRI